MALDTNVDEELRKRIVEEHLQEISRFEVLGSPSPGDERYDAFVEDILENRIDRLKKRLTDPQGLSDEVEELRLSGMRPRISLTGKVVPDPLRLPNGVIGRLVALSLSLRPYRYLNVVGVERTDTDQVASRLWGEHPELVDAAQSPERGQLVQTLIRSGVNMEDITKAGVTFRFSDLRFADFDDVNLEDLPLSGANLSNATLREARAARIDLSNSIVFQVQAQFADFTDARIYGANLDRALLTHASLKRAQLQGTSLRGAVLANADLTEASLAGADLRGARLSASKLMAGSDLTDAILDGAIVPEKSWLEGASELALVGFDSDQWEIRQEIATGWFAVADGDEIFVLRKK